MPVVVLHVPPLTVAVSEVSAPTHTVEAPETDPAIGSGFTVITVVRTHPSGEVYVIRVVPDATPLTVPEAKPMVALAGAELLHVPPPGGDDRVVDAPTHTVPDPEMAEGRAFTVTSVVATQPVVVVYVMVAVPAAMPDTRPVVLAIVAIPVLPELQVPPAGEAERVAVLPAQSAAPVTGKGSGCTVNETVRMQPVGNW